MNRFLAIVVHNWPLKLAAVGLATLLYGGLILSQDTQTFPGPIPITQENPPANMFIGDLPPVTSVRYFAPAGVDRPGQGTFRASVDLGRLPERAGTYDVRVQVTSVNPQIQIRGVEPEFVTVTLDPLVTKIVPVVVNYGEPPDNVDIGEVRADPSTVTVTGQQSIVDQVVGARADVQIQSTGLNLDQDVALVPVDALGSARSPAGISPTTARVTIRVLSEADTRSLAINPVINGTPAAGFELEIGHCLATDCDGRGGHQRPLRARQPRHAAHLDLGQVGDRGDHDRARAAGGHRARRRRGHRRQGHVPARDREPELHGRRRPDPRDARTDL